MDFLFNKGCNHRNKTYVSYLRNAKMGVDCNHDLKHLNLTKLKIYTQKRIFRFEKV